MLKALTIFSGNANRELAQEICSYVEIPLGRAEVTRFSDGEIYVEIDENVRGVNCFVVQPTCVAGERQPDGAADHDRRAQARVGRLDHRDHPVLRLRAAGPQESSRARRSRRKLVADLITAAGVDRVLSRRPPRRSDPGLLQHPVRSPVRDAGADRRTCSTRFGDEAVVVSPDAGGVERARAYLEAPRAPASPSSTSAGPRPTSARSMQHHRRRQGPRRHHRRRHDRHRRARCARPRRPSWTQGARAVHACASHGVLSRRRRSSASRRRRCRRWSITDTIPLRPEVRACPKIKVLSVARLLGEAIKRIHHGDSISSLFI